MRNVAPTPAGTAHHGTSSEPSETAARNTPATRIMTRSERLREHEAGANLRIPQPSLPVGHLIEPGMSAGHLAASRPAS